MALAAAGIGAVSMVTWQWLTPPTPQAPDRDIATASAQPFESRIQELSLPELPSATAGPTSDDTPAPTLETPGAAARAANIAPGQPTDSATATGIDTAARTEAAEAPSSSGRGTPGHTGAARALPGEVGGDALLIGFGPGRAGSASRDELRRVNVKVRSGDSLYSILRSRGISGSAVPALLAVDTHGKELKRIHPGQSLELHVDRAGLLQRMDYRVDELTTVSYQRQGSIYAGRMQEMPVERRKAQISGDIRSSLFLDGLRVGLPDRLIMQMAEIFGWDIDFALDLRAGDRFTIVYEELVLDGRKLRDGDILAAEFVNRGNVFRAVRFAAADGSAQYYTPDGLSMRKAFIRTPVKFARISSRFDLQRRHPILHKIRAHRGVDYAAPTGTPIRAAGDGRVDFLGTKGGYGKTIVLRHGSTYTTLYAHMNGFARGLRQGVAVRQGQVIGYVGNSGLATGPHLHYEFRVNGQHKDPLRVELPKALPIDPQLRPAFRDQTDKLVAMLDIYSTSSMAMR